MRSCGGWNNNNKWMSFVGKFTPQIKQKFIEGSGDDDVIIVGIPFGICGGGGSCPNTA